MKPIYSFLFICLFALVLSADAQNNVGISPNGALPDQSAQLDVQSTARGMLVPRMTAAQRQAISLPATGLLVYQTDGTQGFYYNNGTPASPTWVVLATATQGDAIAATFNLVNSGTSAWLINNTSDYVSGNNANPIITLQRGLTYKFNINVSGHPFRIASSSLGNAFNTGVSNNDVQNGTIIFKVPMDAPNTLFYYCTFHSSMSGTINIQ